MGERRIRAAVTVVISVNLLLLVVGSVLRASLEPRVPLSLATHDDGGKQGFNGPTARRTEPYIVPRVSDTDHAKLKQDFKDEFSRTRWGEMFFPDAKDAGKFWKSKLPSNYTGKPDFVLGIPTVPRQGHGYLFATLQSLLGNLNGYQSVVLVVFVGDENDTLVDQITSAVKSNFSSQFTNGMIHVIHPPNDYYPDWKSQLRQSFGDNFERVKWRSKQNVDQLYLMMYSYALQPKYYLMLEDDILAANDYLTKIYLDAESRVHSNFVLISYCQLGAIGKLFRAELLPSIASYLGLFWSDKPLDWLIPNYISARVCGPEDKGKDCVTKIKEVEIAYKPSLFQHVGTKSSFPGKIQKLKDKAFKP